MKYKAALFDLDGVLIDSETLYTEFWQRVGERHHLPSPTFAQYIKCTTLIDILETHFPDPKVRADVDKMLHRFEDETVYPIFDGALDFVDAVRSRGVKTVIVTSSDNQKMGVLYSQHPDFSSHFDAVVTSEDVTHSKPDPEPYQVGERKAGAAPEESVVFEDSFQGLESGRSAKCRVVGITTTNPETKVAPLSDFHAPSIKALLPKIDEIFG